MRFLIVGDSQANGWPGRYLQEILERKGHQVARRAHDGNGPVTWRASRISEYQDLLQRIKPDTVILLFGSNNLAGPSLRSAMEWFRSSHPRVFYSGPPRYARDDRRPIADAIRELGIDVFGSMYIDAYPSTSRVDLYLPDGIHMNQAGGLKWATAIAGKAPRSSEWLAWISLGLITGGAFAILSTRD